MAKKRTREEIIDDIYDYIMSDSSLASDLAEKLDYVDEDERWHNMDELDSMLEGDSPSEIISMVFYGGDLDGEGEVRGEFNPNASYFKFDGNGNLVSSNWADYSSYFTKRAVEDLEDDYIRWDFPSDLDDLFEELESTWDDDDDDEEE